MEIFEDYFIKTFCGKMRGDCTSHDEYEPIKPISVKELCEYILTQGDWGYIGIKCKGTIFGNPCVEYYGSHYVDSKRNIIKFSFPQDIENAIIKKLEWDGGWSRADWLITI